MHAPEGSAARRGDGQPSRLRDAALASVRPLLVIAGLLLIAHLVLGEKPWVRGTLHGALGGEGMRIRDWVVFGLWWASALNAALVAALLLTSRRWLDGAPAPRVAALAPPDRRPSPLWIAAVLAAMGVAGALAAPRLPFSLWDDEVHDVRHAIDGSWKSEDGELRFRAVGWVDTLFYYRLPRNHVPHSVLARLSLETWRSAGDRGGRRVDERALRLPAFTCGVLAVGAAGLFLWRAGFPGAGALLAWLVALHPCWIRYASEARGYSLALLLISVHLALGIAALHRGSWPRWLGYGAAQFLLLWTHPATLHLLWITNLAALAALATLHRGAPDLRPQLARLAVANLAGAIAFLEAMGPNLAQLHLLAERGAGELDARWLRDLGAYLLTGMPWRRPDALGAHYPQWLDVGTGPTPTALRLLAWAAVVGVGAGFLRLATRGRLTVLFGLVLLLPGPASLGLSKLQGTHLGEWHLIFALPAWGALLALGCTWPVAAAPGRVARAAGAALAAAALASFVVASAEPRQVLRTRSLQPRLESVAMTRSSLDPLAPGQEDVITVSWSVVPELYDPRALGIHSVAELDAVIERAEREGRPLFVNLGWLEGARRDRPELTARLLEDPRFEQLATLHGFEPRLSRHVFRYRASAPPPGGASPPSGGATPPPGGASPPSGGATPPSGGASSR